MPGFPSVGEIPEFGSPNPRRPAGPEAGDPYCSERSPTSVSRSTSCRRRDQFWNTLYKPALGYDLAVTGWSADFDDPITYMGYWASSSMDHGVTYENAEFDALLIAANKETNPEKRAEILGKAEAMFSDNAPAIPLLHPRARSRFSPTSKVSCSRRSRLRSTTITRTS